MTAKIISFATFKGGSGKTTLSFNFGSYLALHKKHVLFFDLDTQMNMTSNFTIFNKHPDIRKQCSIYRAFAWDAKHPSDPFPSDFHPAHINKYVDAFASSPKLDQVDRVMGSMQKIAPMIVFDVINSMHLQDKYDYIILDTHNNFKTLTENALLVSDIIFSPIIPNRYGIDSMPDMINRLRQLKREFYDFQTGKSRITAKLYFVGNMIKFNTKASHQFKAVINNNKEFVAAFHSRELFNRATTTFQSIYSLANKEDSSSQNRDHKVLQQDITPNFSKMNKIVQHCE